METIFYISIGLILGGLIGVLIFKLTLQKNFVPKIEFETLQTDFSTLRVDNATRLSKDEVANNYVSKELHESVNAVLTNTKEELQKEKQVNKSHQETIVQLTGESEQKLSRADVEQNYVAKETFDIVNGKLKKAETDLTENNQTILDLNNKLTKLQEQEENLNEKLTTFKTEVEALHDLSKVQFKNLATDILEEKKRLFVETNKTELNTILDPFKTNLTEFKDKVEATRKEDIQDMTSLKKEIESLQRLNSQLSDDARNLSTALKSEVKMQGSWGEERLNMILEVEGLQKYIDYTREEMYRDEEQEKNRKPDFILKLPNGKCIVIDSKVSLTAYVNYFNANTAEEKVGFLKQHLKSVVDHIEKLADKNYQSLAGLTTPDYVFMFMPVESALTLALNQNPEIFDNALKRKIVLITPTTLVATLKIVKILWQKENQVKNVEEIFKQCGELYNKFVSFLEEMDKIETGLHSATKAHQDAMFHLKAGTKKGNTIIGRFETIRLLEAKTNKRIPAKYIAEIDLLDDDNEVKVLDTGSVEIVANEEKNDD
ncbi:MAG: DNA recombination protein RmuC [Ignavibacteriae bacterium]|nr:DNA recombination protein RmuC [Ignavibacteriota bacterium]